MIKKPKNIFISNNFLFNIKIPMLIFFKNTRMWHGFLENRDRFDLRWTHVVEYVNVETLQIPPIGKWDEPDCILQYLRRQLRYSSVITTNEYMFSRCEFLPLLLQRLWRCNKFCSLLCLWLCCSMQCMRC